MNALYDNVSNLMKKFGFIIILSFIVLPYTLSAQSRQVADRVVAVVNNEVITQSEFDIIFRPLYDQIKESYDGPNRNKEIGEIRIKLLNQMIEDRLVYQEAMNLGIEVSDSDIQEKMVTFKGQFPNEEAFQEELKISGMTEQALEKRFRERVAISRLHQYMIRGKVIVSPSEVEQFYEKHTDEFSEKEQVEVWSITIRKADQAIDKGMTDEEARKKAQGILGKLNASADFEEVAKKNSEDGSAEQGGYVGMIERDHFFENLDEVLFSLPANSISDVIESERGYHIFKVGQKKKRVEKSFDEVREQIENHIYRVKSHERFMEWMKELKEEAYISIR
jgi:peptidyl-prolyl cis-trans isomerase SurA